MYQVALLIFDEAHHTFEKHPYNLIMHQFYHPLPKEARPRVFGMTASPLNTKSSMPEVVINAIRLLECHLDATVVTVKDRGEVEQHAPVANQELVRFVEAAPLPTYKQAMQRALLRLEMAHKYQKCVVCIWGRRCCWGAGGHGRWQARAAGLALDGGENADLMTCSLAPASSPCACRSLRDFQTVFVKLKGVNCALQLDHLEVRTSAQRIANHLQQAWDTTVVRVEGAATCAATTHTARCPVQCVMRQHHAPFHVAVSAAPTATLPASTVARDVSTYPHTSGARPLVRRPGFAAGAQLSGVHQQHAALCGPAARDGAN